MQSDPTLSLSPKIKEQNSSEAYHHGTGSIQLPKDALSRLISKMDVDQLQIQSICGNTAVVCCINDNCKVESALSCFCEACQSAHYNCGETGKLRIIAENMQRKAQIQKQFFARLYQMEEQMIQRIREQRQKEIKKYQFGYLGQNLQKVAHQLFNNKDSHVGGMDMLSLNSYLKRPDSFSLDKKNDLLSEFQRNIETLYEGLNGHRQNYINHFLNHQRPLQNKQMQGKKTRPFTAKRSSMSARTEIKIKNQVLPQHQNEPVESYFPPSKKDIVRDKRIDKMFQDSKIMSPKTTLEKEFILNSLEYPKQLNLIFRASDHDFQGKKFHEKCDQFQNTFVILRNEYNKIIGAYTPLKLIDKKENCYTEDKTKKSFIMSLNMKQKMSLVDQKKAIMRCNDGGPIFGLGHDLNISDLCNQNQMSFCRVPWSYNNLDLKHIKDCSAIRLQFSGNQYGKFRVLEYEVFKVIFYPQ